MGLDSLLIVELRAGRVHSKVRIAQVSSTEGVARLERSVRSVDAGGDSALVALAFSQDEEAATAALKNVQSCADQNGIHVLDLLHVFGAQWRSILCLDEACCPKAGNAIDVDLSDEQTRAGEPDELPAPEFRLRTRTLKECEQHSRDEAFANTGAWPTGSPEDLYGYRDTVVTEVMTLLTQSMDEGSSDFWSGAASVGKALHDIRTRDGVLRRILDDTHHREIISKNLVCLYRTAPIEYRPAIATVFAGARWLEGDRIATRHAIDIALDENPDYSLARLLDTALIHAVPHRVWIDSLTAVPYEKCLAGAA
jgi:hypothetical protein